MTKKDFFALTAAGTYLLTFRVETTGNGSLFRSFAFVGSTVFGTLLLGIAMNLLSKRESII